MYARVKRRTQPRGSCVIDWTNPLARGLVSATPSYLPIAPAPQLDGVLRGFPSVFVGGSASTWNANEKLAISPFGLLRGGGGAAWTTSYQFPECGSLISASGEISAVLVCQSLGQDANGNHGPFNLTTGAAGQHYPYIDGAIYIGPFSSNRWVDGITPTTDVSVPHVAVITARANDKKFYLNGVVNKTSADAPAPAFLSGGYAYLGETLGAIFACFVWDRYLAVDEVWAISQNPWQIFISDRRIATVGAAAGGAPYTMPADAGAYTLTGTSTAFDLSVAAATSSYALTGNAAAFDLRMAAGASSYTLTASAAAFDLSMAAGVGSYALTGTATALDLAMAASVGSYALTGIDATLTYTPTSILTYAPTRDVSSGNWTGGYTTIDESTASDVDYAQSGINPTADAYRFAFDGVPSGVRPTTGHIVRYRIKQDGSCNATIKLYSGSTLVSTWTHTPAPSDWTTYEQTLDATAAGNISTSSADLNLEIVAG